MRSSAALLPLLFAARAHAFGFIFETKATQCGQWKVTVDGGTAPYRIVLVPTGALPNGQTEIRTIIDQQFDETSHTFPPLAFPGGSSFIAIMSDSTGMGTGGTSVITDVATSDDTSCLATQATSPLFFFFLDRDNAPLAQCQQRTVGWSNTEGDVTIWALIPGGESFSINVPAGANSVQWTPQIPAGTQVLLVAGDGRGRGTGGSTPVAEIQSGSDSCLNGDDAFQSTASPWAGGQYMTWGSGGGTVTGGGSATTDPNSQPSGSSNSSNTSSKNNTPLIVGAIVGGIALIALVLLGILLWKRRRDKRRVKDIDILKNEDDRLHGVAETRPEFQPTPFIPPPRASTEIGRSSYDSSVPGGRRESVSTWRNSGAPLMGAAGAEYGKAPPSAYFNRARSPGTVATTEWTESETGHETSLGTPLSSVLPLPGGERPKTPQGLHIMNRPVSFVQHTDAGIVPAQEQEVVELPPSYAEVRRGAGGAHISP